MNKLLALFLSLISLVAIAQVNAPTTMPSTNTTPITTHPNTVTAPNAGAIKNQLYPSTNTQPLPSTNSSPFPTATPAPSPTPSTLLSQPPMINANPNGGVFQVPSQTPSNNSQQTAPSVRPFSTHPNQGTPLINGER